MRNDPAKFRLMVESMVEMDRPPRGLLVCIGRRILWNVPPVAIKLYLDLSAEMARCRSMHGGAHEPTG